MSKYKLPYHFVEFASGKGHYFDHVMGLLEDINAHVKPVPIEWSCRFHEVGCGEGLILSQVAQRTGWLCTGNDADKEAVRMARLLVPFAQVSSTDDITTLNTLLPDVVLFSDSLEHIPRWRAHLEWAMRSQFVIIAVPDMHDRHGVQDFQLSSFDAIFSGWENPVKKTRSHRHVTIWKNPDKDA